MARQMVCAFATACLVGWLGVADAQELGSSTASSCANLTSWRLPQGAITSATTIERGAFHPPSGPLPLLAMPGSGLFDPPKLEDLQPFCRVVATLRPTADSDIGVEIWLPLANWNGKFLAVGNAGWAGSIMYTGLMDGLRRGYATASTDTGHKGSRAQFALGHPEKLVDFAYRAVHEMTVAAKALISTFYGEPPRRSNERLSMQTVTARWLTPPIRT
jgi:feruloyl esterase